LALSAIPQKKPVLQVSKSIFFWENHSWLNQALFSLLSGDSTATIWFGFKFEFNCINSCHWSRLLSVRFGEASKSSQTYCQRVVNYFC
jgi:hypothetical protein